jgi:hypothetical protein
MNESHHMPELIGTIASPEDHLLEVLRIPETEDASTYIPAEPADLAIAGSTSYRLSTPEGTEDKYDTPAPSEAAVEQPSGRFRQIGQIGVTFIRNTQLAAFNTATGGGSERTGRAVKRGRVALLGASALSVGAALAAGVISSKYGGAIPHEIATTALLSGGHHHGPDTLGLNMPQKPVRVELLADVQRTVPAKPEQTAVIATPSPVERGALPGSQHLTREWHATPGQTTLSIEGSAKHHGITDISVNLPDVKPKSHLSLLVERGRSFVQIGLRRNKHGTYKGTIGTNNEAVAKEAVNGTYSKVEVVADNSSALTGHGKKHVLNVFSTAFGHRGQGSETANPVAAAVKNQLAKIPTPARFAHRLHELKVKSGQGPSQLYSEAGLKDPAAQRFIDHFPGIRKLIGQHGSKLYNANPDGQATPGFSTVGHLAPSVEQAMDRGYLQWLGNQADAYLPAGSSAHFSNTVLTISSANNGGTVLKTIDLAPYIKGDNVHLAHIEHAVRQLNGYLKEKLEEEQAASSRT